MTILLRARRLWPGRMPFDPYPRNRVAKDDVLDAMAAAHTASCFLQGLDSHLSSLGKNCFGVDLFESRPGRFTRVRWRPRRPPGSTAHEAPEDRHVYWVW